MGGGVTREGWSHRRSRGPPPDGACCGSGPGQVARSRGSRGSGEEHAPRGMARSEPPIPTGNNRDPCPQRQVRHTVPVPPLPALTLACLQGTSRGLPACEHGPASLERLAVGSRAVHREGTEHLDEAADRLRLPHLLLHDVAEPPLGDPGDDQPVDVRAVHWRHDERPGAGRFSRPVTVPGKYRRDAPTATKRQIR